MTKPSAGSCHFSHSHSGIAASGIGGGGRTLPLRGPSLLITERINFVVFLHITAASLKCSARHTMVTETRSAAFCFHFLVFYKKHAFSLFCSNIQGPGVLRVKHWERILSCSKTPLLYLTFFFFITSFLVSQAATHFTFNKFFLNVECTDRASSSPTKVKICFAPHW